MNKLNAALLSLTLLLGPQHSPQMKSPELSEAARQTHKDVVSVTTQAAPPVEQTQKVEDSESEEVLQARRVLERNHLTNSTKGFKIFAKQILPQLQRKLPFELQINSHAEDEVRLVLQEDDYMYVLSRPNEDLIDFKYAYNLKFEELHEEDGVWVTTEEKLIKGNMPNLLAEKIRAEFLEPESLKTVRDSEEIGG